MNSVGVTMPSVQKVRYGSYNLLIVKERDQFVASLERAVTRETLSPRIVGTTFENAVTKAKLEALRFSKPLPPDDLITHHKRDSR
jgi:hypothetical protein